jgi:hypothetical protein
MTTRRRKTSPRRRRSGRVADIVVPLSFGEGLDLDRLVLDPLWSRLLASSTRAPSGCLLWNGSATSNGYGDLSVLGKHLRVHRVAYVLKRGPVPAGMDVGHTCHDNDEACRGGTEHCIHRRCFEPSHLELQTRQRNSKASGRLGQVKLKNMTCRQGHLFDEQNTYIGPKGDRQCRACKLEWQNTNRKSRAKSEEDEPPAKKKRKR